MVKLCRVNKDDKNVGTMSEGVFSGRDFPSFQLWASVVRNGKSLARACGIASTTTYNILMEAQN